VPAGGDTSIASGASGARPPQPPPLPAWGKHPVGVPSSSASALIALLRAATAGDGGSDGVCAV